MPTDRILRSALTGIAGVAIALTVACTRDGQADQSATGKAVRTDSAAGQVVGPSDPYAVGKPGSAAVAVVLPKDTIGPATETGTCEVAPEPPASTRDAVVW